MPVFVSMPTGVIPVQVERDSTRGGVWISVGANMFFAYFCEGDGEHFLECEAAVLPGGRVVHMSISLGRSPAASMDIIETAVMRWLKLVCTP